MDEQNLLETMCIGRHSYLNKPGSQPRGCNELGVEKTRANCGVYSPRIEIGASAYTWVGLFRIYRNPRALKAFPERLVIKYRL